MSPAPRAQRWLLVVNGKAAGDDDLREAVRTMRVRGARAEVRVTWEDGDAAREVDAAIERGVDCIVAVGGDGTLSNVAAALARRDEAADALPSLGLVPMGTANDFASAAGIAAAPLAALELLVDEPARPIDLLRLEGKDGRPHWAANLVSGGFGTQVTLETDEGLKKLIGGLAYLLTGMARLGRIEPQAARMRGPGFDWAGDFIALGVGNGRRAGGGQALCPDALLDDGLLDLCIVPTLEGEVGATLGAVMSEGHQAALERVAIRARLPWLELETDTPLALNLDGEPVDSMRFRIDVVACRLRMHLPADCPMLRGTR